MDLDDDDLLSSSERGRHRESSDSLEDSVDSDNDKNVIIIGNKKDGPEKNKTGITAKGAIDDDLAYLDDLLDDDDLGLDMDDQDDDLEDDDE